MSRPVRILDVIHVSSSANTLLKQRVLALRARGFDNRIACAPGPYVRTLREAGIPVHTVWLPRVLDPFRLVLSLIQLGLLMRRERVDVVHTHCSIPGVIGRMAARWAGVPVIVHTVHGFHFHPGMSANAQRMYAAVERWCGGFTDVLLTQNRSDLECAVALDIGRIGRRRCIGNGIDLARFDLARRVPAGSRIVLTCVARMEPVKNHRQLLQAAAIVQQRGQRFELWLVGDGPLRDVLEGEARTLRLAGSVRFLGYRDDVPELLARTHIAVLTSVKEGIPRALLEAMAMEIPVVATRVKGNDEVVRHGEDGFLVPLGDTHSLAATLSVLIDDSALREHMGRNGRQRALAEFDELEVARRLGDLYEEECARTAPSSVRPGASPAPPEADATPVPGVAHSAAWRLAAQIVSAAVNVAGLVLLGRALGAGRYGEYAWLYAFIPLVASVCDLGTGVMVTRDMAWRPHETARLLGDGLAIKGAVLVFLLLSVTLAVPGLSGSAGTALALLIVLTAAIDPSQDPASWVLRARGRSDLESVFLVVSQLVWFAVLWVGVALHADIARLLAATLVAYAVRLAIGAAMVTRRWGPPRFQFEAARSLALIRQGLPFGLAMSAIVLYGRIGVIMLKGLATSGDVAHFQVAYLLSQPFGFIASALALAVFPVLTREWRDDPARAARRVAGLARLLLAIAVPLALGLALGADRIIAVLFAGRDYEPAAGALRLTALVLPFVFLNLFARYALAVLGEQAWYLRAVLVGCAVNTILCLGLIPSAGLGGACLAYVFAELSVFLVCGFALRRRLERAGAMVEVPRANAHGWAEQPGPRLERAPGTPLVTAIAGASGALALETLSRPWLTTVATGRAPARARPVPAAAPMQADSALTVLRCADSDESAVERLAAIAGMPCVEEVLALPDLHHKPHMETPSSLAVTTRGAVVPEFTSVAVNDGMGVVITDLAAHDLTPERIVRLFTRVNAHAAAHVLDANRYSLSQSDLVLALTEGARVGVRRFGLDPDLLERMEWGGRFPIEVDPGALHALVPRLLRRTRAVRCEMGLNFGGNHFLEAQAVDCIEDPMRARAWGLNEGQVVFMYHLGPGPFSGTLLHHFTRREKLPRTRAAALFASKLGFHYLERAGRGAASEKWRVHFRRNGWTALPEDSDEARLFQQALAIAMNFGFAYRLATVAAIRDALGEMFGAGTRLLCDVQHNSIAPETREGRAVWVARHNACRLQPDRPAIVAGAHDVPSFLAWGVTPGAPELHSYDHGAGHLIERWRRSHPHAERGERCLRVNMSRGRQGGVRSRVEVPLASAEPILELLACLEQQRMLHPAVRLRPLATLKN